MCDLKYRNINTDKYKKLAKFNGITFLIKKQKLEKDLFWKIELIKYEN